MSEYVLIIIWMAVMALFQRFIETDGTRVVLGKKRIRKKLWFAVLVFVPLVLMAVYRDRYIGDTLNYIHGFEGMPSYLSDFTSFYKSLKKDRWFYAFEALIHIFISKDYKVCFFILATIQAVALVNLYRKYSSDYLTAVFIFVTCGDFVSWMQNGIRQFVAVSICLMATAWMLNRKFIPSILTILIASRFHQSALIMIPIFLVSIGKPWNVKTLLVLIGVLFAIAFVSQFTNLLDTALEETQYENVVTDWKSWNDNGTNPIRVLVYSVPAILSLIGLRYIYEANDPVIDFCANMAILTMGLYLVSMVTSGIFIGRLPIYASLYSNGILLPWELKHMFNKDSSRFIYIVMIIGFLLLYIYQMHFMWGIF